MSTNSLLTGEQLINLKSKSDRDLPHIGEKEFSPSNSWLEKTQIENALIERKHLLEEQRVEKKNNLSCATWIPEAAKAKVLKKVGKHWESLGHHLDGSDWLYPEEALVLLETNCLELILYELPLSIERAHSTLINDKNGCNFDEYRVYSHLVRNGYRLFRHSSAVSVTRYEKDIHLEKHVLNDKTLYSADCDKSKRVVEEIPVVNNEPSGSPNLSVDSVVECRSFPENVEESNSSSCHIVAEKSAQSVSGDQSAPETEANVDVVSLEVDDPDVSIVETVPSPQSASKASDKPDVIDLSSSEDSDNESSDGDDDEEEEDDDDNDDDNDDDSVVEVPIREKEIIYAEISSDESVTETDCGNRENGQNVEQDSNEEEEEEGNEDDDDDDEDDEDDENDCDSEESGGANWKRRPQQSNGGGGPSQEVNTSPDNQASSTSTTVVQQQPIPVRTPFVTIDEFLFPRPDKPNYRVVVDTGNRSLNQEVSRFYEEIEVIDLDSENEDETVAPQVEVLPRIDILQMLPVLRGTYFKFNAPNKYLPNFVKPVKKDYNVNFSLDNWTVIRGDNNYQRNTSRQKNTSHFNQCLKSRMSARNNVIVQRSNPSHQQLLHTPHNRIHPMNSLGAPAPFMNNPMLNQFSCMMNGIVKNEFQQQLQHPFRNQPTPFQQQIHQTFNDQTIQFQQHLNRAFNNQTIQFQQQLQQTFNNQPNNFFRPSLLGAPPGVGGPLFPQNNFLPLMPNNPNFNPMNNLARTDFLGFHVKTENNQASSNPPNLITPQQNFIANLPQNANLNGVDGNGNLAATSSNSGADPSTNPQEYLRFLMSLPRMKGKQNRKRLQLMKRLRKFLSNTKRAQAVTFKTENLTNTVVNVKTEKQKKSNKKRKGNQKMNNTMENDPLSSQITFDTTGGDPAVFVEDIPLVIPPPPNRNNAATPSPNKRRKRKRKNSVMNTVNEFFCSKRVKPDPESVEEVSIISDSAQEGNAPIRRPNRRRYFGLRNGERLMNRNSQPVVQVSTFGDNDVIRADVILIDQANTPSIKSEFDDPIVIVDDTPDAVCKPEPVDIKPQIENMEVMDADSRDAAVIVEVKQELVDAANSVVKAKQQSAVEVGDKVVDSTTTSVPSDLPIKTEDADEGNTTPVRETSEVTSGDADAVSWAQLKEKSPARAAPRQSSSDSEDDSSSDDDPDVVQPILKPRDCQSLGTVLKALQVVRPASFSTESIETLKITFDVYIPSPSFKKSTRGLPNYRLVVRSCSDPFLSAEQMAELNERFEDCVPILLAVVLPDSISFSTSGLVNLPTLNEID